MTKLIQQLNFSSSISKYDVDVAGLESISEKKWGWVFLDFLSNLSVWCVFSTYIVTRRAVQDASGRFLIQLNPLLNVLGNDYVINCHARFTFILFH